jgi:hypothetical protein
MPDPGTFTTLHIAITAAITAVGLPGANFVVVREAACAGFRTVPLASLTCR